MNKQRSKSGDSKKSSKGTSVETAKVNRSKIVEPAAAKPLSPTNVYSSSPVGGRTASATASFSASGGSPHATQLCEPLAPLDTGIFFQALASLFPRCPWTEECRFDMVFSGFALVHLVVQMQNIYRFNLGNWDYVVLLLGALVICKRTLCRLVLATAAEFSAGSQPSSNHVAGAPSIAAATIKTGLFAVLLGVVLLLASALYEQKGTQVYTAKYEFNSSTAVLALAAFAIPITIDFALLAFWGQLGPAPHMASDGGNAGGGGGKEGFPGVPQKTWDTLSLKSANDKVVQTVALGAYGSLEAFYVAGVLPMLLADSEMYTFNSWHCQQTALYILIASLSLTMVHKLASTIADFSRLESRSGGGAGGGGGGVAGFLPLWLSANSMKIYIMIAMARFVLL